MINLKNKLRFSLLINCAAFLWIASGVVFASTYTEIPIGDKGQAKKDSLTTGVAKIIERGNSGDPIAKGRTHPGSNVAAQEKFINEYNTALRADNERMRKEKEEKEKREREAQQRKQQEETERQNKAKQEELKAKHEAELRQVASASRVTISPDLNREHVAPVLTATLKIQNLANDAGYTHPSTDPINVAGIGKFYAKNLLTELEKRARRNDQIAAVVFEHWVNLVGENPTFASGALRAYNEGLDKLKEKKSSSFSSSTGGVSSDDKKAYEGEIVNLKNQIKELKAQLALGGATPASVSAITKICQDLSTYLMTNPKPVYRGGSVNIKNFLDELLDEGNSDKMIDQFLDVIKTAMVDTKSVDVNRCQLITNAFQELNADSALKEYNKNFFERQLKDMEDANIAPVADPIIANLTKKDPDNAYLLEHPLQMLIFTSKDKTGPVWQGYALEFYTKLMPYASLDDIKVAYRVITKIWKKKYNPENTKPDKIDIFLQQLYDRIESPSYKPSNIPANVRDTILPFIDDRLKKDQRVDYVRLENDIISRYRSEYNFVMNKLVALKDTKPLFVLMERPFDGWEKQPFSRADYDKFVDFFKYFTIDELQALLYHIANIKLVTLSGSPDNTYFFNSLFGKIEELTNASSASSSPPAIPAAEKSQMLRLVTPPKPGLEPKPKNDGSVPDAPPM